MDLRLETVGPHQVRPSEEWIRMRQRTAVTVRRPREPAELGSKSPAGERKGGRSDSDDLLHGVDPLQAPPGGSVADEAWAGWNFPAPPHRTLASEAVDVQELSEPDGLVGT